ncbi:MAG TPA: hypothetical protein DCZ73_04570 [Bacteroides sp.]|nr:hypothetical protein [Bacteroides sp.]
MWLLRAGAGRNYSARGRKGGRAWAERKASLPRIEAAWRNGPAEAATGEGVGCFLLNAFIFGKPLLFLPFKNIRNASVG